MSFPITRRENGWFFISVALLFLSACDRPKEPGARTAGVQVPVSDTVSLCFYNVENLFDLQYDGLEYPEFRPGALGWNQQTFEKKLDNITGVIAALDADIVALCEIENRSALEALRESLKKRGKKYPFMAIADLPNRTVTCPSLLSRYPISHSQGFGGGAAGRGRRNILEADIDCGGVVLKVFVNHWPSKAHPESQRLDMARALAQRIGRLPPRTEYVVIGDLNCDYDEWSKLHTEGLDDTKGVVGLNHVLKTVRAGPSGDFAAYITEAELRNGDSGGHYDVWLEISEANRFTRKYRGARETPDHFLIPGALFDSIGISYLDNSFETFAWDGRLLRDGEPYRWQMRGFGKRKFHAGEGYSDHLPLRIRCIKRPFAFAKSADSGVAAPARRTRGGFEQSMEGWMACGAIGVSLDSVAPASGRYCLRLQGSPPQKNCCAARTVLRWEPFSRSRRARVAFDIRGEGKLSLRMRSGRGSPWRYYNGESFAISGSARYLPVRFPAWKHVVLSLVSDTPASLDIEIELRAGKEAPFSFCIDNLTVRE